jgi:YggT family protein
MSLLGIVDGLVRFYSMLIFAYVILSWFPSSGLVAEVKNVLAQLCEPYISLFRRILPVVSMGGGGIDFSPLVALVVLQIVIRPVLLYIVGGLG